MFGAMRTHRESKSILRPLLLTIGLGAVIWSCSSTDSPTRSNPIYIDGTEPPVIDTVTLVDGQALRGVVVVEVGATDNVGVVVVESYVDIGLLAADSTAPWVFTWDTRLWSDGWHEFTAVATDNAERSDTSIQLSIQIDNTPPDQVILTQSDSSQTSITLRWQAPGDDGNIGQATSYDLRYSTSPIDSQSWADASPVQNLPSPASAGTWQTVLINGLSLSTTYYFRMVTEDKAGGYSSLSDELTAKTVTPIINVTPTGPLTIQQALDSAKTGYLVQLAQGTYYEHDIIMKSGVHLRGDYSHPYYFEIDAMGAGRGIICRDLQQGTILEGIEILNAISTESGGGVYCEQSELELRDCTIYKCTADSKGGGLYVGSHSKVGLINSTFSSCYAGIGGGAYGETGSELSLHNCAFHYNTSTGDGGGFYSSGTLSSLEDCSFNDNDCQGGGGGAYITGVIIDTVLYSSFDRNTADSGAGALIVGTELVLQSSTFDNNVSTGSGGGLLYAGDKLVLLACILTGDTAMGNGGGLLAHTSFVRFDGCEIRSNKAVQGAGAYFATTLYQGSITDCQISTNLSLSHGGGLFGGGNLTLQNCIISGNRATGQSSSGYGGAIHWNSSGHLQISECTLTTNEAIRGGGVYSTETDVSIMGSLFNDNGTDFTGGAVESSEGSLTLTGSTFIGNHAGVYSDPAPGGAVHGWSLTVASIDGCIFNANRGTLSGGAVYLGKCSPTIAHSEFRGHTNAKTGGALALSDCLDGYVDSCIFIDNSSLVSGGAIAQFESRVNISFCVFYSDYADSHGGALYLSGLSPLIVNCTFFKCSAQVSGSSIYCQDSNPQVTKTIMANGYFAAPVGCSLGTTGPTIICSDIYGHLVSGQQANWTDCISDQQYNSGNLSSDPMFCSPGEGDLTLMSTSPCTTNNSPCGELIGAHGVGCSQ